jgi:para-nitrobenzyl esterase
MNFSFSLPRARFFFCACLLVLPGISSAAETEPGPIARTAMGNVRGRTDAGVNIFKGIPYGGDTAQRRFQSPVAPAPWTGVRDTIEFAPMAPQPAGTSPRSYSHGFVPQGEDCLNLNVWTPALRDGRKRPVFVYFHGGGYNTLSANQVDGTRFSRLGDAVVVGVNHRLNGFGFLFLADLGGPEFAASGNAGLHDLVRALQWVRENITEFGGDPGRVTIFGESGGASKCAMLMAMPSARGLFHRVWTSSGAGLSGLPRARATAEARLVLKALDLTPERIAEIKTIPMERLVAAMGGRVWAPVVDGDMLPRHPFVPDASPLSADIPMVIGTTRDEMMSFLEKDPAYSELSWEKLQEVLTSMRRFTDPSPEKIIAEYRRLYPEYSPRRVLFAVMTVVNLWGGIVVQSEKRAAQSGPTYVYCLDWPANGQAAHAIDLWLMLNDPDLNWRTKREPDAQRMADLLSESLLAFGRTGEPAVATLPRWPRFNLENRPTMIFDLPPRLEDDPRGAERRLLGPK